ncbi:MAG: hypothetical protein VE99_C0001G0280 [candidate division Kazan bacterium GW2011_GWC1_52_13]|uniref:AmmeMemoRadiSam system protein B n=2 Tax=Bacteria division Kazan-3B-28 TaxID=1798534 RepID=A0A0G1X6Z8_UNCK3|nr:MAG: hypothetical protein VE99_C0001G0280 [candidate division Kazan bacterium GW2011_GWC1_52_13]KKW26948.1 MAG: hypothetical protein VF00_C0002G0273 [candidate division Kazan bacterium GW2011_GWB1_52_7]
MNGEAASIAKMRRTESNYTWNLWIAGLVVVGLLVVANGQPPVPVYPFQALNWQWILDLPGQDPIAAGVQAAILPHDSISIKELTAFYRGLAAAVQPRFVVILSPNHYDAGRANIQTTSRVFMTADGRAHPDWSLVGQLRARGLAGSEGDSFTKEHGITAQVEYAKRFFPEARWLPLIFKSTATPAEVDAVMRWLEQTLPANQTLVLASIDFSHYLTKTRADINDTKTYRQIQTMDVNQLPTSDIECEFLDSPAALRAVVAYAHSRELNRLTLVRRDNTADIRGEPNLVSTTGHLYITFS